MQLILLSGGSGKRLWPLSNNTRSKQFLPLLEGEDGKAESMVQRVVRQARQSGIAQNVTIATNAVQRDIIVNQLGEGVSVLTEPERRDTFPAIALAAAYLAFEKHCTDDEVVVVMPCDPYTDSSYFEAVRQMVSEVEKGTAELVLMGITPREPSSKYGYIVPEADFPQSEGKCCKVARFVEKPDTQRAGELLRQGALWNGGVFAFKLGYLTEILKRYNDSDSFDEIRAGYSKLPKISFDYEVVEKAASVGVVRCCGRWKDLGTWNTLTEEIRQNAIGNAIIGSKCVNTHVINELQYPIYAEGLKDVVVAACPDGILVCSKSETENIKRNVEGLGHRPMYEERRWGTYRVIDQTEYSDGFKSLTKSITLKAGKCISYQIHHHRSEVWTFADGEGLFVLDGEVRKMKRGDIAVIPPEHYHSVKALTDLTFIEVQSGSPLVEEDIERFEWDWDKCKAR